MEEDSKGKTSYDINTQDILENIDCQELANLLSDEQFIGQFMKSLSKDNQKPKECKNSLSQREMELPDFEEILKSD